ncbi:MAG: hypothetical protein P8Z37_12120 [Acidobacteriota bacterium]|jgi:hypothetical protein
MVEFTSAKPHPRNNRKILFITVAVLVLIIVGILAFMQNQSAQSPLAGESGLVVPDLLRPGDSNFEYYKTKVQIEDVQAVLQISFNNVRTAKISGTIYNDGDRKLDALEMHIVLYDVWGKVSKERTAFALRPKAGFSSKPMEPLERRRFEIGVESVELYWNPDQVSYEITGLRYQ